MQRTDGMARTKSRQAFAPGKDWVWYAPNTKDAFGKPEIDAVRKSLEAGWLTTGATTRAFEARIAGIFGKKYALFVNSGSSANLLAFEALAFPKGSEVITAACNFNTTVAPILQCGLVPVFVDVKEGHYTLDPKDLKRALSRKTRAIIVPHLIGNIADMEAIWAFAKKHKLIVIEDSCDTIGASYKGKKTGAFSHVTTTSFYASHLITTGGAGGMLMFNDKKLRERARVFRDWGRGISRQDESIRSRLATFKIEGRAYDSAFVFAEVGYNMRPTEMQAAFGLAQLARLPKFLSTRRSHFNRLRAFFKKYPEHFILPQEEPGARVHWLAFPLTLAPSSSIDRNALVRYLEDHKIQTRPLFSGNIVKHPPYRKIGRRVGKLTNADLILKNGLLIGAHHGLTPAMVDHVIATFERYIADHRR